MNLSEPILTASLLAVFGLLMALSVLLGRTADRLGVPIVLLFLVLGVLAGSQGIIGVPFEDYRFAFRIGTIALILILFDGGLNTSAASLRRAIAPASALATVGVVITAGLAAIGARLVGVPWPQAMLLGAVVSSTDAATVFAVLRGSRLQLQQRVGTTLELESGLNDPMAVILTTAITQSMASGLPLRWSLIGWVILELALGALLGAATALGAAYLLKRIRLQTIGLFPVFTLGVALLAFGITTLLHGSGFLAVYIAAIILGNTELPSRSGLRRIHDALAWLGQIGMFIMLGLLVFPSQLIGVAWIGLLIALFLTFIARPVAAFICLLPFGFPKREIGYIGWAGLRGAVPIILATIPIMAHVEGAQWIFNVVFFIVVINAIVPGATLGWITRRLGLDEPEPPAPAAVLEIISTQPFRGEILSFFIDPTLAVSNISLARIHFPHDAAVILVVRGQNLIAGRGNTVLQPGDHVYVACQPEDRPYVELLFGRPEEA